MEKKTTLYDIESNKFNEVLAVELKKMPEFEMPEWAKFVKTSVAKARPPAEKGWWHKRAAGILRQLYTHGIVGVSRLRTKYGARKNRGMRPPHFYKGSGKIIRLILQEAEKAGLVEKAKGKKAGRMLSKKGKAFMDEVAVSAK